MSTIAVSETAESTAVHGFWTRSVKAGLALMILGVLVAGVLGILTLDWGDVTTVRLNLTTKSVFEIPAMLAVTLLGLVCAATGAMLFAGLGQHRFGWVVSGGLVALVLGLIFWVFAIGHSAIPAESMVAIAVFSALPLIYGSLAGVLCERSGVINVAIEGQLLAGAFAGALFGSITGNIWFGIASAAIAGCLVTILLAFLALRYAVDQVVLGVVLNILVLGLTGVIFDKLMAENTELNQPPSAPSIVIPILSDIPVIGPALFGQNLFVYLAFALVAVVFYLLFNTKWGLRTRSVGEHPAAADTVGINVNGLRFMNVAIAGLISGTGGAVFTIGQGSLFVKNMTVGLGFVALAMLIVGRWNPLGALAGALLFGFSDSVQRYLSQTSGGFAIPSDFLAMLPYLVTIIAVAGLMGKVRAPAADGKPYIK
ncbi:MAG TPA: ABC transporter permease [Candidatus Stackebrandtia faecavium]|nr:ABC transporter permease [Candidatus Stackebrandtia faecavium]